MAAVTVHNDFGAQENKICHHFKFFCIYLSISHGNLNFLNVKFWACFFSSFIFIKKLFSSSSLSSIKVVSSAYLRLLIFLPVILIPAGSSSSPAFHRGTLHRGLPLWLRGKKKCRSCKKGGFDPWIRKIPWRRAWQPTPVFLSGESHGRRSLAGYSTGSETIRHD